MEIAALIKRWFYGIVFIPGICFGQIFDDFSDGEFATNPQWDGDMQKFKVNADLQLQLNDENAGTAYLFTSFHIYPEMEWRCWVKQSFSPSANNYGRLYLFTDTIQSLSPPDGIFLQLGEGGSNDAICLMTQLSGDTSTLIRGSPGNIASSFECRIKTLYSNDSWLLLVDYSGGENYMSEGMIHHPFNQEDGFLGVMCNYTSSNSTKFYFDDFYAGPEIHDTIPPEIKSVFVSSPLLLEVFFSESPETESAAHSMNYEISGGIGFPETALLSETDPLMVNLILTDSIPYGALMQINIQNIKDLSGNIMIPVDINFSWYHPARYEVVINEIMADPSPPQYLPEYEYIELFNTTGLPLDLTDWILTIGTSDKLLPKLQIESLGYLLIGKASAESSLKPYGSFYGLESFALINGGQSIILSDDRGEMISGLYYSDKWYADEEKTDGGWSLEQINPYNPCLASDNWKASEDGKGGSPGKINSVFDDLYIPPQISSACILDSVRIALEFNQSMSTDIVMSPENFQIDHGVGKPLAILPDDAFFRSFILYPANPLLPGILYELSLNAIFSNCQGDSMLIADEILLGLPEAPSGNDLVINEILFNPFPGGNDYVEVYNRSQKAISMTGLILGSVRNNPPSPPDTSDAAISTNCCVLLPGEYALLCKNAYSIDKYYYCENPDAFLEINGFPSYSNEEGTVILFDKEKEVIDVFSYHEDMQYPLLNSVEGVSLERIHFDRPAYDETNWHSASQLSGFGTPGYKNSQFSNTQTKGGNISVSPQVFTPGNDGQNDYLNIRYHFDKPGYLATIMVFNTSGKFVRQLVNNELLGTEGTYAWDGIMDNKQKAPAGIYIIFVELTDLGGKIMNYKKTAVIAPGS